MAGVSNAHLAKKLDEFISTYERDMRGDKDLDNGNKGMVGEIREIKRYMKENPSITWLLKNRLPITVSAIVGTYIFLRLLWELGLLPLFARIFGIELPI